MMDFEQIVKAAEQYKPQISSFLRDMIAIPSESAEEGRVIQRIKEEMEEVGFDKVEIDPMGNVLGYIGHGRHLIAMDAHIDTVGIGDIKLWKFDPIKALRMTKLSRAGVPVTKPAVWLQWFMLVKSLRI